jgi:Mg2+/Co2+ transporter CorB
MAETAMMAANRYRLRSAANQGSRGARLALDLLGKTDKLLGIILLCNNLVNAAAATLVSVITIQLFGSEEWVLGVSTLVVTFLILVFSEITPKVVGANHANRLACIVSYPCRPCSRACISSSGSSTSSLPASCACLRLRKSNDGQDAHSLSTEELRTMVLESGAFIPPKHRSILLNLFELEDITVEDVMTPRNQIEAVNIADPISVIQGHLATCYHTRLPVFDGEMNAVIGLLHVRRCSARPWIAALRHRHPGHADQALLHSGQHADLLPAPLLPGKPRTPRPGGGRVRRAPWPRHPRGHHRRADRKIHHQRTGRLRQTVLGQRRQRDRRWQPASARPQPQARPDLPVDGPKTLNGLVLEHLQDIPESGCR